MVLIEREKALGLVCEGCNLDFPDSPCEPSSCQIRENIMDMPTKTLDDLRPHGFWVVIHDVDGNFKCCSCSECGEDNDRLTKCCPSCGARMDKRIKR